MMRRSLILLSFLAFAAGCGEEKAVRFGAILPLTGPQEIYGQPIKKGIELAYEQIEARDDFPFKVELTVLDSEGDPDKAKDQLSQLYAEGAMAVIGGATTAEALRMVAIADEYDRVLISPSASSPELTGISKNFYRVFPSDAKEGTTMGNFAANKLRIENIVILAKEDPYAMGIQEVFKDEFERHGGEVLDLIEFPAGSSDFSGLVDRVMTLEPDAVYLAAYAQDIAGMITPLRARGFKGTIFTTAAFAAPEVIEQVGKPAEGVFLTQAVFELESEDEAIRDFVASYQEKYGLLPDLYAAHGFDSMMVLAAALEKSDSVIPKDLWKGITSLREMAAVTGMIQFDERGDVQKFPRVYVIEEGSLIDYEKEVERRRRELLERLRELEQEQRKTIQNG